MVHWGYHPTNTTGKPIHQEFWPSHADHVQGGCRSISLCQEAFMMWRVFQFIEYDSWAGGTKINKINIWGTCTQTCFFLKIGTPKVLLSTKIAPLVWVFPHFPAPNLGFPVRWPQLERSHFQTVLGPFASPFCWDLKFRTTKPYQNHIWPN